MKINIMKKKKLALTRALLTDERMQTVGSNRCRIGNVKGHNNNDNKQIEFAIICLIEIDKVHANIF